MPDTRNSIERVDFIAAVEEFDGLHPGDSPGERKLFGLELVVILPGLEDFFEKVAVRHANFGADFKFCIVQTFCFTQDAAPAF